MATSRRKNPLSGFKHAQDGILHCFRTQPHMRIHFVTLVAVLMSALLLDVDRPQMLALIFAITLVIVTEMLNTAIEKVVDMVRESYSPAAKLAKDVAAGAVLLAAMNAIIAGILVFFGQNKLQAIQNKFNTSLPEDVNEVVVIGIVVLTLVVIISKLLSNTGTPWHGGIVSGHSAIGFMLAMTIFFTSRNTVAAFLAILLAVLVAQSRVEAGVHSLREVVLGAVLAILLTSLMYWIMPKIRHWVAPSFNKRAASFTLPLRAGESIRMTSRFEGVSLVVISQT